MELINKDAVLAEIKKRIRLFHKEKEIERQCPTPTQTNIVSLGARIAMLQEIKVFIDTLKAKDVDKIIESAEDHAYLAGSEKMREKIMAKAVDAVVSQVPCANEIIFYSPHTVRKNSNIVINMMNLEVKEVYLGKKYIDAEKLIVKIKGLYREQGFDTGEAEGAYKIAIKDILVIVSSLQQEQRQSAWSEADENLLNLSLENLAELKNRFDEKYGKVGDCIDWLKSLKQRLKGETK